MKRIILAASIIGVLVAASNAQTAKQKFGTVPVAPQSVTDPIKVIYRISGVESRITISPNGVATSFICTNYSQSSESIGFVLKNWTGEILANWSCQIGARQSVTAVTRENYTHPNDIDFDADVTGGSMVISSSTTNMHCSADIVNTNDAANIGLGIALHMVRFNAHPGSVE